MGYLGDAEERREVADRDSGGFWSEWGKVWEDGRLRKAVTPPSKTENFIIFFLSLCYIN